MRDAILREIDGERLRQDARWGRIDESMESVFVYVTVLAEEVGEVAQAAHDVRFAKGLIADVREEALQAAAVAVQIIERIDTERLTW